MTSMELSLADGWTQVEPKETQYELLISAQSPEQQLVAWDTGFHRRREIGFSGGSNCPIAVDETGDRVFVSVDGIVSYDIRGNAPKEGKISEDVSPFWMLAFDPAGPELLMHLDGDAPMESFVGRMNLRTGDFQKWLLPQEAFFPIALNSASDKALYSTHGSGAALYSLQDEVNIVSSVDLSSWVSGGTFDTEEQRIILGGNGLVGWDTASGSTRRLCDHGIYPAIDGSGEVWFSYKDGALAKLNSRDGSFEVVAELSGLDTSASKGGGYAQPIVFSPDARYGLARLTGREKLTGRDLEDAEAFCKSVGQPFSDFFQYRHEHYFCVLDLELQHAWCSEGYADNIAWILSRA